ncbi:MAG TPA: hypothetical protein VII23_15130 [Terriglobales bacterium]
MKKALAAASLAITLTGIGALISAGHRGAAWFAIAFGALAFIAIQIWWNDKGPEVVLEFSEGHLPLDIRNHWVGERPVYLHNIGKSRAQNATIEQLTFRFGTATQEAPIPLIEAGDKARIKHKIEAVGGCSLRGVSGFETLLHARWCSDWERDLKVPMRILYEDGNGKRWRTEMFVKYGLEGGSVIDFNVKTDRLRRFRKFPASTS